MPLLRQFIVLVETSPIMLRYLPLTDYITVGLPTVYMCFCESFHFIAFTACLYGLVANYKSRQVLKGNVYKGLFSKRRSL